MNELSLQPREKTTAFDQLENEMALLKRKYALLETRVKVMADMFWINEEPDGKRLKDIQTIARQTLLDLQAIDKP